MSFSWFITRRLVSSAQKQYAFSKPIIRLSVVAIAFSVVVIIISLATGMGLQHQIKSKITSFSGQVQLRSYESSLGMESSPILPNLDWVSRLKAMPEIEVLQPVANRTGILKSSAFFEGAVFKGVNEDYNQGFIQKSMLWGRIPNYGSTFPNDSIVISKYLYNLLAIEEGERIAMYFFRQSPQPPLLRYFHVSGVFETGLEQIDEQLIIGDLRHLIRINGWDSLAVGGFEIFLRDGEDMMEMTQNIREVVPFDVEAISAREQYEQIFQWVDLFDVNIIIIFIVMMVVSAINISSALMIMLLERTPMVGLLKALGASNVQIRQIFLNKSLMLLLKGLLWGNGIGLLLCWLQSQFTIITLDQSVYYVSHVPIYLKAWWVIGVNIATVGFCLLCLLLPSLYISSIRPAKTIDFK
ncbi:MAG: ABC transporter permease [Cryomorphaceae bacterium]|nr:ABC transporter permease [Cryomorphaceae bacterium]